MGISSTKEDVRMSALIVSVSTLVKTYCGRTFLDNFSTDKTEIFNVPEDINFLQLDESPIVSITSVEERSSYSEDYVTLTTTEFEYYLDPTIDAVYKTNGATGFLNWAPGPGSVKIIYKGGFADTPEDLKLAVADLITYYHKNEYKGQQTLAGATSRTPGTTTQPRNVSFPDHIKRVLDLYKVL